MFKQLTPVPSTSGGVRAMWHQVCIETRIELTPEISDAIRALLAPAGDTLERPAGGDLDRAARLLEVAGLELADPIGAVHDRSVWLAAGKAGGHNLALCIDASASDLSYVSTWRPALQRRGASSVLAQAGLGHVPQLSLLDTCTRWIEQVSAAADRIAARPFETRILAWPMGHGAAGQARIVERYFAGGPGAQDYARERAAYRQAQIEAARRPLEAALRKPALVVVAAAASDDVEHDDAPAQRMAA